MHNVYLLILGLFSGVLSGMFGIGGGVIIIPALILLFNMPIQKATGTSLGALLLPVGLLGAMDYYKNNNLNLTYSLLIAIGLFSGAYFGARIAQSIEPQLLKRIFGAFIIIIGARLLFFK